MPGRLDTVRVDSRLATDRALRRTSAAASRFWHARTGPGSLTQDVEPIEAFETAIVDVIPENPALLNAWHERATWLSFSPDSQNLAGASVQPVSEGAARALDRIFSMASWQSARARDVVEILNSIPTPDQIVVIDVGQGSANAILDHRGQAAIHFDVGCGMGRNAGTAPKTLSFCCCASIPTIILSHWDSDHWWGAKSDARLLAGRWLVPRQSIGPSHAALARDIISAGGEIFVVKRSSRPSATLSSGEELRLLHGVGKGRNDSGQSLLVVGASTDNVWLLPGDCRYDNIDGLPDKVSALVASHHGAKQPQGSAPPLRAPHEYGRLVYSVGRHNSYRHPRAEALGAHESRGWRRTHTRRTANVDSRASIAIGWDRPPKPSEHLRSKHGYVIMT